MELIIIAAVAENLAIGKNNDLVWRNKEDLKRFKSLTEGHVVIMGSNTADSLPKPLPNRLNIVLHEEEYIRDGFAHFKSLESALESLEKREIKEEWDCSKVFIIGGGMLYKYAMQFADRLEITHVKKSFEGDVFFPIIDDSVWIVEREEDHDEYTFVTYTRR